MSTETTVPQSARRLLEKTWTAILEEAVKHQMAFPLEVTLTGTFSCKLTFPAAPGVDQDLEPEVPLNLSTKEFVCIGRDGDKLKGSM